MGVQESGGSQVVAREHVEQARLGRMRSLHGASHTQDGVQDHVGIAHLTH